MTTKIAAAMASALIPSTDKADKEAASPKASDEGKVVQLDSNGTFSEAYIPSQDTTEITAQSADPATPAGLEGVIWMSDGTGAGDSGDLMVKLTGPDVKATATWTFSDKPNEESWILIYDGSTPSVGLRFEIDNEEDGIRGAYATFTFSDKPNEESTITLIDDDGTTVIFEIDNEMDGAATAGAIAVDGIAAAGGNLTGTAADLVAKINAQSALNITATNPSAGKVVLIGAKSAAGNTAIATDDGGHWNSVCSVNVPSAFVYGDNIAVQGIAAAGGSATGTRTALMNTINAQSSMGITVSSLGGGQMVCTQDTGHIVGNTTITTNDSTHWDSVCSANVPSAFTGGAAGTTKTATIVDWSAV